jgi:hypothetical protein
VKPLSIIIFTILLASSAYSQVPVSVGGTLGVNFADLRGSAYPSSSLATRTTVAGGGLAEFGLTNMISLQPEVLYVMSGGTSALQIGNYPAEYFHLQYDYLEIPLLVKVKFAQDDLRPYVFGGPAIGFNTSAQDDIEGGLTPFSSGGNIKSGTESLNCSVDLGAGAEYPLTSSAQIFADVRYALGITNINTYNAGSVKTGDVRIFAGVKFRL